MLPRDVVPLYRKSETCAQSDEKQSINHLNPNTMAKFKPMELISEMHGKFSGKSEYYAAERYGTQYTGKIGENTTPPTPAQEQTRQNFSIVQAAVNALSQEEKDAYAAAFKRNPGKYKTLRGYMIAQEYAKLV